MLFQLCGANACKKRLLVLGASIVKESFIVSEVKNSGHKIARALDIAIFIFAIDIV